MLQCHASPNDEPDDPNDPDEWIDQANAFCIEAINWTFCPWLKAACYATDADTDAPTVVLPRSNQQLCRDEVICNIETYLKELRWPNDVADNQI